MTKAVRWLFIQFMPPRILFRGLPWFDYLIGIRNVPTYLATCLAAPLALAWYYSYVEQDVVWVTVFVRQVSSGGRLALVATFVFALLTAYKVLPPRYLFPAFGLPRTVIVVLITVVVLARVGGPWLYLFGLWNAILLVVLASGGRVTQEILKINFAWQEQDTFLLGKEAAMLGELRRLMESVDKPDAPLPNVTFWDTDRRYSPADRIVLQRISSSLSDVSRLLDKPPLKGDIQNVLGDALRTISAPYPFQKKRVIDPLHAKNGPNEYQRIYGAFWLIRRAHNV